MIWLRDDSGPPPAGTVRWLGLIDSEEIAGIEFVSLNSIRLIYIAEKVVLYLYLNN